MSEKTSGEGVRTKGRHDAVQGGGANHTHNNKRRDTAMNLYIGNLSRAVGEDDLNMLFQGLGEVVFAKFVGINDDDRARGYAFVHIADEAQAHIAIDALHGKFLKGLLLIVRPVKDHALEASVLRASLRAQAGVVPVGERRPNAPHLHLFATAGSPSFPN